MPHHFRKLAGTLAAVALAAGLALAGTGTARGRDFRDTNGTGLTASLCDPYNSQQWWALG